jgi:hypothetical protein
VPWRRQLDSYPNTGARVFYLAITVLATVTLYYELYVGGSVSTLLLTNLNMTFTFYVVTGPSPSRASWSASSRASAWWPPRR